MTTKRLGILGGSFNPIHFGHLLLAQAAMETFDLSKVLFIPCAIPPHKNPVALAPAEHRLAMLEAAIEDNARFEVSDMEIRRNGPSYTIDTIKALRAERPGIELYFIMGIDMLMDFHSWRNARSLLELCHFVTFARPGFNPDSLTPKTINIEEPWAGVLLSNVVTSRQVDISSSDIRHRLAEGMSIRYLVPQTVEMYILEHRLYVR